MKIKMVSGQEVDTVADFGANRAVIDMDNESIFLIVDRDPNTGLWDESGTPASQAETVKLKELEAAAGTLDNTVTDIVKDD